MANRSGRWVVLLAVLLLGGPLLARPADARNTALSVGAIAAPAAVTVPRNAPRLLVRFAAGASAAERAAAVVAVGGTIDRDLPALGAARIALTDQASDLFGDTPAAVAILARDPAIARVEADGVVRTHFTPNDSFFLTDPGFGVGQWGLRKTLVDRAWDGVRGSAAITVATVDTGIDAAHPDLAGAVLPGATFVSSPSSGCSPGTTFDDSGHGTHVAGIIGANGNNGQGIAGAAFGVRILPVKALDCQGTGLLSDVASGIIWAVDQGARVINISLGSDSDSPTLHDAIRYAVSHNVLVVAAAGNCGDPSRTYPNASCPSLNAVEYPGAYPEVLAVAATDGNDAHAAFSNTGAYVGISAPGVTILSTVPTYPTTLSRATGFTSYAALRGTSQAAPLVAGIAALVLGREPGLTVPQIIDRLKTTADDLGVPGTDPVFGAGRVNALRATTAPTLSGAVTYGATYDASAVPSRATAGTPFTATIGVTNRSSFPWNAGSAGGTGPVRLAYHWSDTAGNTVVWDGQRSALPADVAIGASAAVSATIAPPALPGTYVLRVDLVREGIAWFSGQGVPTANVTVALNSGLGATYAPAAGAASTFAFGSNTYGVALTNTGTRTWSAGGAAPVHLSYHWLTPAGAMVVWDGARAALPSDLGPGQSVVVALPVVAPAPGSYLLRLDLVEEGVAWFSGQGVPTRDVAINVSSGIAATVTSVNQGAPLPPLLPGGRIVIPLTVRNDGAIVWPAGGTDPVHVAVHLADAQGATIRWDGDRTLLPSDVAPGQSVTTTAIVAAPLAAGSFIARIDLVREGVAWFSGDGVRTADLPLTVAADFRAGFAPTGPLTVSRSAPTTAVTVTNTGGATWTPGGAAPLSLSAHWLAADGTLLLWDGPRTAIASTVAPGGQLTLSVRLAPPPSGAAQLVVDVVADGLRWFAAGSPQAVTLVP
ncbi:MAG TPA: S8 family serine peptidase [Candidatus Limnocylindria bacterium]